ncbi:MAG: hypothetical protein U1E17_05095 [Geminicoccaceae bacterium]
MAEDAPGRFRRFQAQLTADPPAWPKATDRLATVELEIALPHQERRPAPDAADPAL